MNILLSFIFNSLFKYNKKYGCWFILYVDRPINKFLPKYFFTYYWNYGPPDLLRKRVLLCRKLKLINSSNQQTKLGKHFILKYLVPFRD